MRDDDIDAVNTPQAYADASVDEMLAEVAPILREHKTLGAFAHYCEAFRSGRVGREEAKRLVAMVGAVLQCNAARARAYLSDPDDTEAIQDAPSADGLARLASAAIFCEMTDQHERAVELAGVALSVVRTLRFGARAGRPAVAVKEVNPSASPSARRRRFAP